MTGGRLKRLEKNFQENENFFFTYGDGISSVNLNKLLKDHKKKKKLITVTAVRPPARFGELIITNNKVISFKGKPQTNEGWSNGGFFVAQKKFFKLIKNDYDILEKNPWKKLLKKAN